jgi:hypothetical protein
MPEEKGLKYIENVIIKPIKIVKRVERRNKRVIERMNMTKIHYKHV